MASGRPVESLIDLLEMRAAWEPDRPGYTFLVDGEDERQEISWSGLERRARAIGAELQRRCAPGDRVVVLLPPGLDFIAAFLACSYAGAVAVPAFRPTPARPARMLPRLARIAADAGATVVLAHAAVRDRVLQARPPELAGLHFLAVEEVPDEAAEEWRRPTLGEHDLALLQYTSGSTSDPKGVMVTHGNLLANLAYLKAHFVLEPEVSSVLWVPPYHDLGLVGGILLTLYNGNFLTLMAPWHFLQRPYRWLQALSETRSTHTAAPNFALELCVRTTTPEERAALDLSPIRMLLSGGEPVQARTADRFAEAFAVAGFDPQAITPAYGLAEATLMVAAESLDRVPARRSLDGYALRDGHVRPAPPGARGVATLVGCGAWNHDGELRVVDPEARLALPSGRVGEIWVRGPSVAQGYWNRPELTEETFGAQLADGEGPFLRTGDLGFVLDDELYVAGRLKDLIIVHGFNYHPQDLEQTATHAHPSLVHSGGAAFEIEVDGEARLGVVHEVEAAPELDLDTVAARVQEAIAREHELPVHRLVLIRPGTLPRTRNGKIRRALARQLVVEGGLTSLLDHALPGAGGNGASAGRDGADDQAHVAAWLEEEVRRATGGGGEIRHDAPVSALGLDSVQLAEIVQRLETSFRVALPLSDVSGEISIAELAAYVVGRPPESEDGRPSPARRARFDELPEVAELRERLSVFDALGIDNPFFRLHERVARATARVDGREVLNFASYNYLALSGHEAVSAAAKRAIDDFGTSVSASRIVSGERALHLELERAIASWLGTESCVVFVSGNLANVTTLGHLAGPRDLIVHDALAHDSIVQGALLSGAARRSFPHGDWRALDRLLDAVRDGYERVIVAIEGVYSMDGDIPDLPRFVEVKDRHEAFLMVDEAHSFGVLGRTGRGIAEHFGLDPAAVEIWMGTLSKTLASSGGYIAGSAALADYLRYSAPGFVFSVGLPPPNAAAALAALRRLEAEPERVERLRERSRLFLGLARAHGLDTGLSEGSPVIPVVLGRSDAAVEASNRLLERGVNVQPIVHPAVEEDGARLRFFVCADHTEEQIRTAVAAVAGVVGELGGDAAPHRPAKPQPASTLGELLELRAAEEPGRTGYVFLGEDGGEPEPLSYGELELAAARVAARLRRAAPPGERAILLYPAGLDFVVAFFACVQAGVIAVPAPSPLPGRLDRIVPALRSIVGDCEPRAILTTSALRAEAAAAGGLDGAEWIATDVLEDEIAPLERAPATPDDVAYLQYTSGSTASPRGAIVRHANVLANLDAVRRVTRQGRDGRCVSWLPHYHDMGLAGLLGSLYLDHPCMFMSPLRFMARPLSWLGALSEHGGTWTGAPSFAFELCARRARPADLERLDLERVEWIGVGAEPVRADALERFLRTFAPAGLREDVLAPCYGLAESVVLATGPMDLRPVRARSFDAASLERLQAVEARAEDPGARTLVACGVAPEGHEVAIADPETGQACQDGRVGEIWLRGPSVTGGYWNRPDESEQMFGARLAGDDGEPYLRTGDLGFLSEGELYVAGRLKDLIVVGGANHHPQDVERTVEECHPAIRRAATAAFSVEADVERVVVLAEVRRSAALDEVRRAIAAAVADRHQLTVDGVGLLPPRSIPKTSSGKIRRRSCRELWLGGELPLLERWESPALRNGRPEALGASDGAGGDQAALEAALVERLLLVAGERVEEIDVEEPLIELGLGSLELAEVRAAVEEDLGVTVPLSRLLDGWSVRDIALSAAQDGAERRPVPPAPAKRFERLVNPAIGGLLRRLRMDRTFVRGEGCWLVDERGRRYLDAIAGYGSVPFGHDPAEIWRAVREVEERAEPVFVQPSSLGAAGELAERLLELAPAGLERVTFANSGAEAIEAAIKLVRAASGRPGILSAQDGFHGKTLGALSATARRVYQEPFFAPLPGFESVPYGDLDALERALAERGRELAAFIVEPIQGEGGIVEPPAGYLRGVRELCDRHGVALVLDEVQTGLGRTGSMFVCEAEGVVPDALVVGKALGGGLVPIGAVLYAEGLASEDFALRHTSTFAGGALASRVGLAVLDRLTADGGALLERVRANGARLREGLEAVRVEHPVAVRAVRGQGFLLGLELTRERDDFPRQSLLGLMAEQERLAALLSSYLLEVEGVRVAPTLLASSVLRIEPPLTFEEELCDTVVDAVRRGAGHVARGDTGALVNHLLDRPRKLEPARERPRARSLSAPPSRDGAGGRWAFLVHPIDHASYGDFDPSLAAFSAPELVEITGRWSELVEPFVVGSARIPSGDGSAYGEFVVVPRTSAELHAADRGEALALVRAAIALARARGAEVVGLGGQISVVTGAGLDLGDPGVPLTTGNAFTALSAVDSAAQAAAAAGVEPERATAAVLGAAGSVGRGVALLLAREFERLVLLGNPAHPAASLRTLRLVAERLAASLLDAPPDSGPLAERAAALARGGADAAAVAARLLEEGSLVLGTDADALLPLADVVVAATSSTAPVLRPGQLRPGAVVCDVARPLDADPAVGLERPDALVVEGGLVELPEGADLGWDFGLPPATVFACMCEPMMLALERRYELARVGVETPPELLRTLRGWAADHGFRPAPPRSFGRPVSDEDWRRVRAARSGGVASPVRGA